jgi:DNA-directed RNA polymerase sigma subunit (sigma70/sigma32)
MEKKVVVTRLNAVNEQDVYVLSLEEELQLVDSIRLGGKACNASIEKLSQSNLSFITAVANRYVNEGSRNGLE